MYISEQLNMGECPDIEFVYDDADSYENEMAELYSYTEGQEFQQNLKVSKNLLLNKANKLNMKL